MSTTLLWPPACTQASLDQFTICSTVYCCARSRGTSVNASTVSLRLGLAQPGTFTNLGGRASPTGFTAAAAAALFMPFALAIRPSSTITLCEYRFRRNSLLCDSSRPSFTSRHCDCCTAGAVHTLCSGPQRSSFTSLRFQEARLHQQAVRLLHNGPGVLSTPGQ